MSLGRRWDEDDFVELVWENGKLLTRGLSTRENPYNSSLRSSQNLKPHVKSGCGDTFIRANAVRHDKADVDVSHVQEDYCADHDLVVPDQQHNANSINTSTPPKNKDKICAWVTIPLDLAATPTTASNVVSSTAFRSQPALMSKPPNQPSRAVGLDNTTPINPGVDPSFPSSTLCTRVASNSPATTSNHHDEDVADTTYPSLGMSQKSDGGTKAGAAAAATGGASRGIRRNRSEEVNGLSEKKRQRCKINKKMWVLRQLIPNCSTVDRASMLDEAIEYLKLLKLQVQMMWMGRGVCMPPVFFPTGMPQLHASHLPRFFPVGGGFTPAQLPNSPILGPTAAAARLHMFGLPNSPILGPTAAEAGLHMFGLPFPVSAVPFVSSSAVPSTHQ